MSKNKLFSIIFTTYFLGFCNMVKAEECMEIGKVGIGTSIIPPDTLIVMCGKGRIEISYKTGKAEFIDCDLDEATKALWEGLLPYFEAWKEVICNDESTKKKEMENSK